MMFSTMHSRIISTSLFVLLMIFLQSCKEETIEKVNYVARVNDNYLTQSDIEYKLDSLKSDKRFREEFIRGWIDREVLYSLAVEEGILNSREFNEVMELSEKELAISLFLESKNSNTLNAVPEDELRNFYNSSAEFSTLQNDLYIINSINFNNPYAAENFRKILIDSEVNWDSTIVNFDDSTIVDYTLRAQVYKHQLEPKYISKRLIRLSKNEVSSVFEKEPKVFSVVQLVERFEKGSRIPFEYVRVDIKKLYIALKRKDLIASLLDSLYKEFEIEIKSE